ncbi:hypothetical protein BDZ91DRAFT_724720 [Kalaharituber pfeilii]|nr:hypothetical protein BDZ91DRAFT_724720 [Kalaharituber pfeilii]
METSIGRLQGHQCHFVTGCNRPFCKPLDLKVELPVIAGSTVGMYRSTHPYGSLSFADLHAVYGASWSDILSPTSSHYRLQTSDTCYPCNAFG